MRSIPVYANEPRLGSSSDTNPTSLYDQVGNLTRVTDPDSVLAMTYDQANRLLSVNTAGSPDQPAVTLGYAYDQTGNRLLLAKAAKTTSYHYAGLNRLTGLGNGLTLPLPTTNREDWRKGEGSGRMNRGPIPVSCATG